MSAYRALGALFLVLGAGCIQRSLEIESEPAGARVYFDHHLVGKTPLTLRFTHYGSHSLILLKEGYRPYRGKVVLKARGWALFPLDVFSEALLPWKLRDRRSVRIPLERAAPEPQEEPSPSPPAFTPLTEEGE